MAMGKRRQPPKQGSIWVATEDLPRSAAHPLYARLNQILDQADFDGYVESLCHRFYANEIGRPGLPPGRYFRMLLLGYVADLEERGKDDLCYLRMLKALTVHSPTHFKRPAARPFSDLQPLLRRKRRTYPSAL